MNKRIVAFASLAAAGTLALAACTSDSPKESADDQAPDLAVAWVAGGTAIALQTHGSSTRDCYPQVSDVQVSGSDLTVNITPPKQVVCTRDYVPQLTYVDLGGLNVDTSKDLAVKVKFTEKGGGTFNANSLPAITVFSSGQMDGPSAGWFLDGSLALVTWGSGTVACWPVVAQVAKSASDDTALEVKFAEPEGQLACTADLRAQLTQVYAGDTGVEPKGIKTLILSGAGFQNQVVPVLPAKW